MRRSITHCILTFLLIIFSGRYTELDAKWSKSVYDIKMRCAKMQVESKSVERLKLLIKEYERYHSPSFVQEYMPEFKAVIKGLANKDLGDEYEQIVVLFLIQNYKTNILSLQVKYADTIFLINQAIAYWSVQLDKPLAYFFHKNPIDWFNKESSSDTIRRHIQALNQALRDYTVVLGRLVSFNALLTSDAVELSYKNMAMLARELSSICGDIICKDDVEGKSFFEILYRLSAVQDDVANALVVPLREHLIPAHLTRYWIRYAMAIGAGVFLFKQKNDPTSRLSMLMREYSLIKYENKFIQSFKKHVILPFRQIGNILFGIPLDLVGIYPEKFEPLVNVYNQDREDAFELVKRGYNKLPDDFDMKLLIPYPWPNQDLTGYQFLWRMLVTKYAGAGFSNDALSLWKALTEKVSNLGTKTIEVPVPNDEWTTEQKEIFLKTNHFVGYILCRFLGAKADILLTFLNMSHEIDLILKVIAILPAVGLVYGTYKIIRYVSKLSGGERSKLLYKILIEIEECILEASSKEAMMVGNSQHYFQGKLFFLKYYAKKTAVSLFSKGVYQKFLRDMQKITLTYEDINNRLKVVELLIKKYGL